MVHKIKTLVEFKSLLHLLLFDLQLMCQLIDLCIHVFELPLICFKLVFHPCRLFLVTSYKIILGLQLLFQELYLLGLVLLLLFDFFVEVLD